MPRKRTHWEGCWRERTHHECALVRVAALEAELAKSAAFERLLYKIADSEREQRGAAEALLTEARFYMPGHYDFIKPNGGLRDLMCRVDEYFGNQPID